MAATLASVVGGVFLTAVGVYGLVWANTHSSDTVRAKAARETGGKGGFLMWGISRLPGASAKAAYSLLSVFVIAIGVAWFVVS
jgi:hypothetical protein